MWRRHLNNETLVTTNHKEPEDVANGIDNQVKSQMNDKCRVKMIKKELYNVKNPLCREEGKNHKRGREEAYQELHINKITCYKKKASRIEDLFPFFSVFSLKLSLNL